MKGLTVKPLDLKARQDRVNKVSPEVPKPSPHDPTITPVSVVTRPSQTPKPNFSKKSQFHTPVEGQGLMIKYAKDHQSI